MKRSRILVPVLVLAFLILAAPTMNFNVIIPALIDVPSHIKVAAMIDRTLVEDETSNVIEGVITGEMFGEDKLGTQILMDGVHAMLENAATVKIKRTTEVYSGGMPFSAAFPEPLSWEEVEKLCEKYKVDAIVAIEKFDSDFIIVPGVNQTATVKAGIRMYDPESKSIVDQYQFNHQESWGSGELSLEAALNGLISKNAAVKEASYEAGIQYGRRLSPTWYRVSRPYFKKSKGDDVFAEGARMMEVNDWYAAKEALFQAVENGHRKTKGKAAHNLAVVCEIEGNLEDAKGWAQEAWGKYKNKKSKDYLYDLNRRINEMARVDKQMAKK
jgi:hypothetical protein